MPLEVAEALVHGHRPRRRYAEDYPTDGTLVAAAICRSRPRADRSGPGRCTRRGRKEDDRVVAGSASSTAGPTARARSSVGFSETAPRRGQGYAAEAVDGAGDLARAPPGVTRVIAETADHRRAVRGLPGGGHAPRRLCGGLRYFEDSLRPHIGAPLRSALHRRRLPPLRDTDRGPRRRAAGPRAAAGRARAAEDVAPGRAAARAARLSAAAPRRATCARGCTASPPTRRWTATARRGARSPHPDPAAGRRPTDPESLDGFEA